MKIWEPKPPGTLWATPGLLRDSSNLINSRITRGSTTHGEKPTLTHIRNRFNVPWLVPIYTDYTSLYNPNNFFPHILQAQRHLSCSITNFWNPLSIQVSLSNILMLFAHHQFWPSRCGFSAGNMQLHLV